MPIDRSADPPLLLPAGTRLLHIGPPKTGTSALQYALHRARQVLLANDVLYPGTEVNHYRAVYAFMGRRDLRNPGARRAWRSQLGRVPPMTEWSDLMREVDAEPHRRVVISHEAISRSSTAMARAFVQQLGPDRTHIVITLRPPARLLPSRWSELVKEGATDDTFDEWLRRVYGRSRRPVSAAMRRYLDQGGLVQRWARVAGPDRVTVILADRQDKRLLADTFEALVGLPPGTLALADAGASANRSMTATEAEAIRRLNSRLARGTASAWRARLDAVRTDLIDRALARRRPRQEEPPLQLPGWAARLAAQDGRRYAERIAASGVRVVGDLTRYRTDVAPAARKERSPQPRHRRWWNRTMVVGGLLVGTARGAGAGAIQLVRHRISDRRGVERRQQ
jgi:hypothetical protein